LAFLSPWEADVAKSIVQNYSFIAATRQITLTDFSATYPVRLDRLLIIADATTGKLLYNFADGTVATAAISSSNIITLSALQGGESDSDKLVVVYDKLPTDPNAPAGNGPYATGVTVLSTEMDSLTTSSNSVAGTAFDNSALRYPVADLAINVAAQGSARSLGAALAVYMVTRGDSTNFDSSNETTAELIGVFPLDAATTARRRTIRGVSLPPEQLKIFARNLTGQTLAASGTVVTLRPYYQVGG